MFLFSGKVLKNLKIESCGHTDKDFFCFYRYKDEYEPKINKIKYPNAEDRWYEDYISIEQITEAKLSGTNVDFSLENNRIEWNDKIKKFILKKE